MAHFDSLAGLPRLAKLERSTYHPHMSVQEIESAVSSLSPEELSAFQRWFEVFTADAWDRQFEADVKAGKLDALAEQALRDHRAGHSTKL